MCLFLQAALVTHAAQIFLQILHGVALFAFAFSICIILVRKGDHHSGYLFYPIGCYGCFVRTSLNIPVFVLACQMLIQALQNISQNHLNNRKSICFEVSVKVLWRNIKVNKYGKLLTINEKFLIVC